MDIIKLFGGGFPVTTNRLEFLQNTYAKAFSQLSTVIGSGNIIIDGVVNDNGQVSSGVIIIDGEVIEFEGGAYDARVAVFETVTNVPYNEDLDNDGNLDQKPADVVRTARCAAAGGVDSFNFDTLKRTLNILQLMPQIGDIKMIARAYNPAIDLGWQPLDMVDTFPMGAGGTSSVNGTGGENSVTLTEQQLPTHNHTGTTNAAGSHTHNVNVRRGVMTADQNIDAGGEGNDDTRRIDNALSPNNSTNAAGSHTHNFTTDNKGGGQAHENRPKFKAFNFLIFVGL